MSTAAYFPPPDVTVVVPHYDQPERLARCLDSLKAQTLDAARFDVIVVDNASPAGLGDLPSRYDFARFVIEPRRGAAHARNAGLALSRGAAIAFIDADCVAAPDWLERGLEALGEAPLAGGRVEVFAEDPRALSPVEAFEAVFAFRQQDYIERKRFSATANLFVRSDVARAVGPFRHGLAEDLDWCRRAGASGFRLAFAGKAVVSHPARRDWGELVSKWDRLVREKWNGFGRGATDRLVWTGLAAATALSSAPHLIRVLTSGRLTRLKDRLGAGAVLVRIRLWRARAMLALLVGPPMAA